MRVEEKVIKTYVATDGKEFSTEAACLDYEQKICGKMEYFCVSFDFDLCEGRGWQNNAYLAVVPVRNIDPKDIACQYALETYGKGRYLVSGVQGYGAEKTFSVRRVSKQLFEEGGGVQCGSHMNTPERILLSPFCNGTYEKEFNYAKEWNIRY